MWHTWVWLVHKSILQPEHLKWHWAQTICLQIEQRLIRHFKHSCRWHIEQVTAQFGQTTCFDAQTITS